ncbi:hypothetical protein OPT61_g511 [Boeremia exigua]|uniref:Uncharacterized protein n=1 Tax=Boeremia exigua TaxID=749465 RepID=A0ACC2ITS1_9PLEO|nr:hypothetical protein OPT61_g511 [Boeremia exigua]
MVGTLFSCDGSMNLVLADAYERIIRPAEEGVPSEEVPLGLYIVRGDSVASGSQGVRDNGAEMQAVLNTAGWRARCDASQSRVRSGEQTGRKSGGIASEPGSQVSEQIG